MWSQPLYNTRKRQVISPFCKILFRLWLKLQCDNIKLPEKCLIIGHFCVNLSYQLFKDLSSMLQKIIHLILSTIFIQHLIETLKMCCWTELHRHAKHIRNNWQKTDSPQRTKQPQTVFVQWIILLQKTTLIQLTHIRQIIH